MKRLIFGISILTLLAGCSSTPTKEQDGASVKGYQIGRAMANWTDFGSDQAQRLVNSPSFRKKMVTAVGKAK